MERAASIDPTARPGRRRRRSHRRPARSPGLRVAVLDNGKPNAALRDDAPRASRSPRASAPRSRWSLKKGPRGESANAAIPCDPEIFDRVVAEADIVITGTADCGSCTAYSVYDGIELEKAGRPGGGGHHHRVPADRGDDGRALRPARAAHRRAPAPHRRHRSRHALPLGRRRGRHRARALHPPRRGLTCPAHPASSSRSTVASRSSRARAPVSVARPRCSSRAAGAAIGGERHRRRPRDRRRSTRSSAARRSRGRARRRDVTDPEQVEVDWSRVSSTQLGGLDIAVNNVGMLRGLAPRAVVDLDADYVRTIVDQNLTATLLCSAAEARAMVAAGAAA